MKKTIGQKGITLVALIITIVVLLILAVVSIMAIYKENIIGYTEEIVTKFEDSKDKEESDIKGNLAILDEYFPKNEPEECKHEEWTLGYDGMTRLDREVLYHWRNKICNNCGIVLDSNTEDHTLNNKGECIYCEYDDIHEVVETGCGHNYWTKTYSGFDDVYHISKYTCTECGETSTGEKYEHVWSYDEVYNGGVCIYCWEQGHGGGITIGNTID